MQLTKQILKLSLAVPFVLLLNGCFDETVKCSDEMVKETIKEIYTEQIQSGASNPLLAAMSANFPNLISIESIRPISYNKEVKMRECKAVMHFENETTADLSYTIQTNEDNGDDYYIELDKAFLESLIMSSMMSGLGSNK
ncbi:MAG: hypothetical protein WC390_00970 [Sulfurimonas sp.]|jgi:hypothetical protein